MWLVVSSHYVVLIFPSCLTSNASVLPPWLALLQLSHLIVHLIICYLTHTLCQYWISAIRKCSYAPHSWFSRCIPWNTHLEKCFLEEERVGWAKKFEIKRSSWTRCDFWFKTKQTGTSLVAQWLRIRLPMQGTWVWSLVREDPPCRGAAKPACHNYWSPHA